VKSIFPPGFSEQLAARERVVQFDMSQLPPFLRAVLVADGTVTKLLEAYFWEPLRVRPLTQEITVEQSDSTGGGVERLHRVVVIESVKRECALVWARSTISLEQLELQFRDGLLSGRSGIGELLREDRLETYRQVLSVTLGNANELGAVFGDTADSQVARRTYRIHRFGKVLIEIEEAFPVKLFESLSGG
jgi:chorismate-pyruvate lyase